MTWPHGRAGVEAMLRHGTLIRVPPNPAWTSKLLAESSRHCRGARLLAYDRATQDLIGSCCLCYYSILKSCDALLYYQGLATGPAGNHHKTPFEAVACQFSITDLVFGGLDRLEALVYGRSGDMSQSRPGMTVENFDEVNGTARTVLRQAKAVIASGELGPF